MKEYIQPSKKNRPISRPAPAEPGDTGFDEQAGRGLQLGSPLPRWPADSAGTQDDARRNRVLALIRSPSGWTNDYADGDLIPLAMGRMLASQGIGLAIDNRYNDADPGQPASSNLLELGAVGAMRTLRIARVAGKQNAPHYVPVFNNGSQGSTPEDGSCFFHSLLRLLSPEEQERLLSSPQGQLRAGESGTVRALRASLARYVDAHWDAFRASVLDAPEAVGETRGGAQEEALSPALKDCRELIHRTEAMARFGRDLLTSAAFSALSRPGEEKEPEVIALHSYLGTLDADNASFRTLIRRVAESLEVGNGGDGQPPPPANCWMKWKNTTRKPVSVT